MLTVALFSSLRGGQTRVDMSDCAESNEEFLRQFMRLKCGPPSHDAFSRLWRGSLRTRRRCWRQRTRSLTSSVFFLGSGCAFRLPFRVEGLFGFDHFADDAEESVGDASGGSGVLVSAASQRVAIRPADFSRAGWRSRPSGRRHS